MSELDLRVSGDRCLLRVRVLPRGHRTAVEGVRNGALVVRLVSPPVDNRANEELIAFLGRRLGIRMSALSIVRGASSREKTLGIEAPPDAILRLVAEPD